MATHKLREPGDFWRTVIDENAKCVVCKTAPATTESGFCETCLASYVARTPEGKAQTLHFTFTGFHAGQPICGISRGQAADAGDELAHPAYNRQGLARQLVRLCPSCKSIWNSETDDA